MTRAGRRGAAGAGLPEPGRRARPTSGCGPSSARSVPSRRRGAARGPGRAEAAGRDRRAPRRADPEADLHGSRAARDAPARRPSATTGRISRSPRWSAWRQRGSPPGAGRRPNGLTPNGVTPSGVAPGLRLRAGPTGPTNPTRCRRWRCGCAAPTSCAPSACARSASSARGRPPATASTSPPSSRTGWPSARSSSCPAARTASTPRRTGPRWRPTASPFSCRRAVSTAPTRRATPRCSTRVAERGLVVSESPPGCAPQRQRFLTRNRLIAALSTGVVVVEAAAPLRCASTPPSTRAALGRPLMAVPGPVTSAMSAGCHELLRASTTRRSW